MHAGDVMNTKGLYPYDDYPKAAWSRAWSVCDMCVSAFTWTVLIVLSKLIGSGGGSCSKVGGLFKLQNTFCMEKNYIPIYGVTAKTGGLSPPSPPYSAAYVCHVTVLHYPIDNTRLGEPPRQVMRSWPD